MNESGNGRVPVRKNEPKVEIVPKSRSEPSELKVSEMDSELNK